MSAISESTRRQFLQEMGASVALLGLGDWHGASTLATQPIGDCSTPAHGAATPFVRDCRPIRPRIIANSLSAAEVADLKAAYAAMRALDTSDPTDPRGFLQQAKVHCHFCATSDANVQVHFTWRFFAWHRAYLYFHERILGSLIGKSDFRLPYWGWDSASHHTLPNPYVTPNNATNPLFNGTRVLAPGTLLPDEDVGPTVINNVLTLGTFANFGGTATSSGVPEGTPHGAVHVDVGGDMSAFDTAGRDPIFYQHHATVDKLWSDWNRQSAAHTDPPDAAFRNLTFNFFDENKTWRSITAAQVLDHENSLRYVYAPYIFLPLFCVLVRPIGINWATLQKITLPPNDRRSVVDLGQDRRARLHFVGLQVPRDRSTVYRIYGSQADAQADKGPESQTYLGNVGVVLNDHENKHPHPGTMDVIVDLKPSVRTMLARGDSLQPFLVDRNSRAAKAAIPVRARDVLFSVDQLDTAK